MIPSVEREKQPTIRGMQYWGSFFDETLNFDIDVSPKPTVVTPDNMIYHPHISVSSSNQLKLEFVQRHLPGQVNSRINPDYTDPEQRKHDLLTRDSRIRERRKVGTGGKARRKKQSPKR
ncbi:30S ribosomal protein S9 [Candidatus Woesebacteria bacterium]|nr:30S ribosomal protein S9 [Candidatus Woesebacteria bacterium]